MNKQRLLMIVTALASLGSLASLQACEGSLPGTSALADDGEASTGKHGDRELDDAGADGTPTTDGADAPSACPGLKGSPLSVATCTRTFGDGLKRSLLHGVSADADGNIVIVGDFEGTIDFGGGPLVSVGERDGFVVKLDAQCNHLWSKRLGGPSVQAATRARIDEAGNVYVLVLTMGTIDLGTGPMDSFPDGQPDFVVAKLDACGATIWARKFGAAGDQRAEDIAIDANGNGAIVGSYIGDIDLGGGKLPTDSVAMNAFIATFDRDGGHRWSKGFAASEPGTNKPVFARNVVIAKDGVLSVTGYARGAVDFGNGPVQFPSEDRHGAWDARFSSAGALLRVREVDDALLEQALSATGEYYQSARLVGPADLGGGPMVVPDGDGVAYRPAALGRFNPGVEAPFWIRGFGTSEVAPAPSFSMRSIAASPTSVAASVGCGGGTADYGGPSRCAPNQQLVLRYGLDGAFQSATPHAQGQIAATPSGQFVIAASASTTAGAPEKIIITKLAP